MGSLKRFLSMGLLLGLLACPGATEAPSDPVCGNGVVEAGEACDDGNLGNVDSCISGCVLGIKRRGLGTVATPRGCDLERHHEVCQSGTIGKAVS